MDQLTITSIADVTQGHQELLDRITDALGTTDGVRWDVEITTRRHRRRGKVAYSGTGRIVGVSADRIASITVSRQRPVFGKEWRGWGITPNTDDDPGLHGALTALWNSRSELDYDTNRRLIAFDLAGAIVDTSAIDTWTIRRPGDTAGITVARTFAVAELTNQLHAHA
jgi:hypothetical protein